MSTSVEPDFEYDDDDDYGAAAAPKRLYRGRPGLIALSALLAELVVIAAAANQFVSGSVSDRLTDRAATAADYETGALKSVLTYAWRFAPGKGQSNTEWGAPFAAIGVLFVLTVILGWVVSRGSVTFWRIWVSIAALVSALTPLAVMARNVVVIPSSPGPRQSRIGQSVYGYPDFGPAIVFGLALGVVVGLVAAIVAVATRRTVNLERPAPAAAAPLNAYGVPSPGYAPPPWQPEPDYREALAIYGQPPGAPTTPLAVSAPTQPLDAPADAGSATAEIPVPVPPAGAPTEELPAVPVVPPSGVPADVPAEVATGAEELPEPVTAELRPELDTAELPAAVPPSEPVPSSEPVSAAEPAPPVEQPAAQAPSPQIQPVAQPDPAPAPESVPAPTPAEHEPAGTPDPAVQPAPAEPSTPESHTAVLPAVPVDDDADHTQEFTLDVEDLPPPPPPQR